MKKADLHLHSRYSDHPSEWFLQRLGASESYTEPDAAYEKAMKMGMDFVTLTDHNSIQGALYLKKKHPENVFVSTEATAYFPEDGCKIHILLYDITEEQFMIIEKLRENIYLLRNYIKDQNIAHSVAHATYSVNNKLNSSHLEKLILLFDVFEGLNGARDEIHNSGWTKLLKCLTSEDIKKLYEKHKIIPFSNDSWIKGFTAGSDDHAALFIASTFTSSPSEKLDDFVESIKRKKTIPGGRHSNFRSLAFTIYKIAYEFSKSKSKVLTKTIINQVNSYIFENNKMSFFDRIRISHFKQQTQKNKFNKMLAELVEELNHDNSGNIENKLEIVYDKVCSITDELLKLAILSIEGNLKNANLVGLVKNLTTSLPAIFLSIPFLSTFRHFHQNKHLIPGIESYLGKSKSHSGKKILWFTDTLNDLNGVSVTLKKIGWLASKEKQSLSIVTCLLPNEISPELPPNTLNIPYCYSLPLPMYNKLIIKIPSVMKALKILFEQDPDEILISSPGPLGLLGLMMGKLLNVPCKGIYHTDFSNEALGITGEEGISGIVEAYMKWFYSACDEISVPTEEYRKLLERRGYDASKMSIFIRGIDTDLFSPKNSTFREKHGIPNGINLLFAGRISKDKNLDFLSEVYNELDKTDIKCNLIFAGDGPYLDDLKYLYRKNDRVVFTGLIPNNKLPELYSFADILVFPSITDTFGMVVLEAQSCGLPAIVSDVGGPKEIISDGVTGWSLPVTDKKIWVEKILEMSAMIIERPIENNEIRQLIRQRIIDNFSWKKSLNRIFNQEEGLIDKSAGHIKNSKIAVTAEPVYSAAV